MNSTDMRRSHSPAAGLEDIVGRWVYLAHWLTTNYIALRFCTPPHTTCRCCLLNYTNTYIEGI